MYVHLFSLTVNFVVMISSIKYVLSLISCFLAVIWRVRGKSEQKRYTQCVSCDVYIHVHVHVHVYTHVIINVYHELVHDDFCHK